ncbi:MAG: ribonuclease HII [Eubacteriales bacterium]|nr:ribonuclease HII [Eubacteriales bacterium]
MKLNREERLISLLHFDASFQIRPIAGIDEAGRGPLAGPVTAACVIMPEDSKILYIDDSKKLSEKRREQVYEEIIQTALFAKAVSIEPAVIDEINILNATKLAMQKAAEGCPAELFLVDYVDNLVLPKKSIPVVKGDANSYSIAAASIVAKVTRDRYMREAEELYPGYNFIKNKGYGTKAHIDAIKAIGPCPIHRRSFITKFL